MQKKFRWIPRLTPRDVLGSAGMDDLKARIKDSGESFELYRVLGNAKTTQAYTHATYGDSVALVGDFVAIQIDKPGATAARSPQLFISKKMADRVCNELLEAKKTDPQAQVEVAFTLYVCRSERVASGYAFMYLPFDVGTGNDPLADRISRALPLVQDDESAGLLE